MKLVKEFVLRKQNIDYCHSKNLYRIIIQKIIVNRQIIKLTNNKIILISQGLNK